MIQCPGCGAPDDQGCYKGCPEVYDKRGKAWPTLVTLETCPACGEPRVIPDRPDGWKFCLKCDWRGVNYGQDAQAETGEV